MKNITFSSQSILADGKELFKVPYYISDIVVFDKVLIVLKEIFNINYTPEYAKEYYAERNIPFNISDQEKHEAKNDYQNVYSYDYQGNLLWRAEQVTHLETNSPINYHSIYKVYQHYGKEPNWYQIGYDCKGRRTEVVAECPVCHIKFKDMKTELALYASSGIEIIVESNTGKIISKELIK